MVDEIRGEGRERLFVRDEATLGIEKTAVRLGADVRRWISADFFPFRVDRRAIRYRLAVSGLGKGRNELGECSVGFLGRSDLVASVEGAENVGRSLGISTSGLDRQRREGARGEENRKNEAVQFSAV